MDQVKVGKFIAECRKSKNMTQSQLAEKLNMTDRAISKWETGKGMPDSSIMLELCGELGISVNELLSGEKIKMEEYHQRAEENLVKMKQSEEKIEKTMQMTQNILCALCVVFSVITIIIFIVHMAMNYFYPDTYDGKIFEWIQPLTIILAFVFCSTSGILAFRERYVVRERE